MMKNRNIVTGVKIKIFLKAIIEILIRILSKILIRIRKCRIDTYESSSNRKSRWRI